MKQQYRSNEHRTPAQIREHYEIEVELANRLRAASKQERLYLYANLYNELYRRVPLHPQLTRKISLVETARAVASQMTFLNRFLTKNSIFMEIGPGDCALSYEVSQQVKQVYAVDVSAEITKAPATPTNFQLIISDGCSIPVQDECIDIAYSNQLMEHLHPDDAAEQLHNIYNALIPVGYYVCITPNRFTGPHDVSANFDRVATGFHLKEYTISELHKLFKMVGFSRSKIYIGARGVYFKFPTTLLLLCEKLLSFLPTSARDSIANSLPLLILLNSRFVGIK
jgi:SAM-dependent methyltransferase